ncbi:MAG: hypothetical protein ACOVQ2_07600 [Flavobacterium sp.]
MKIAANLGTVNNVSSTYLTDYLGGYQLPAPQRVLTLRSIKEEIINKKKKTICKRLVFFVGCSEI